MKKYLLLMLIPFMMVYAGSRNLTEVLLGEDKVTIEGIALGLIGTDADTLAEGNHTHPGMITDTDLPNLDKLQKIGENGDGDMTYDGDVIGGGGGDTYTKAESDARYIQSGGADADTLKDLEDKVKENNASIISNKEALNDKMGKNIDLGLEGDGSEATPLKVKIRSSGTNIIELDENGLYVQAPKGIIVGRSNEYNSLPTSILQENIGNYAILTEDDGDYKKGMYVDTEAGDWECVMGDCMTASDTTKPVITMIGDSPVYIYVDDAYDDNGSTASDNVDGDLTGSIVTVNNVDTSTEGNYTVTYDVTDAAGNVADTVTRFVSVEQYDFRAIIETTNPNESFDVNATHTKLTDGTNETVDNEYSFTTDASGIITIDGKNVTWFSIMGGSDKIKSFEIVKSRKLERAYGMVKHCVNMTSFTMPFDATKNVWDFAGMFYDTHLTGRTPSFNTSKGTNFQSIFKKSYFSEIADYDYGKAENLENSFKWMDNLVCAIGVDAPLATNVIQMYYGDHALENINILDFTSIPDAAGIHQIVDDTGNLQHGIPDVGERWENPNPCSY